MALSYGRRDIGLELAALVQNTGRAIPGMGPAAGEFADRLSHDLNQHIPRIFWMQNVPPSLSNPFGRSLL